MSVLINQTLLAYTLLTHLHVIRLFFFDTCMVGTEITLSTNWEYSQLYHLLKASPMTAVLQLWQTRSLTWTASYLTALTQCIVSKLSSKTPTCLCWWSHTSESGSSLCKCQTMKAEASNFPKRPFHACQVTPDTN